VIREVERLSGEFTVFIDDNIAGNRQHAKELFERLKPLKKKWAGQASLTLILAIHYPPVVSVGLTGHPLNFCGTKTPQTAYHGLFQTSTHFFSASAFVVPVMMASICIPGYLTLEYALSFQTKIFITRLRVPVRGHR
jgi:hypothetical protein